MSNAPATRPWYRQFWPWFLIGLPLVVVIACLYTVFLALNSPLSVVKDDYYKEGLAINQNNLPYQQAKRLQLRAEIRLLADHSLQVNVVAPAASLILPARLSLQFAHPLDQQRDRTLFLQQQSGVYQSGAYQSVVLDERTWRLLQAERRWYLTLRPQDVKQGNWALRGEATQGLAELVSLDSTRE